MKRNNHKLKNLLLFLFCIGTWHAIDAKAAPPTGKVVTVDFKSASVETVLKAIQKQTDLSFVYSYEQAESWPKITIRATKKPVEEVIGQIAGLTGCSYEIKGNVVMIAPLKNSGKERTITGLVLDDDGNPLPGASVSVPNGSGKDATVTQATTSDVNGRFSLSLTGEEKRIIVSYIGFASQSINISSASRYEIRLVPDTRSIGEVVVVSNGIYSRKAESITGSTATYTRESLKSIGNQNVLQSLASLDPSFVISDNNIQGSDPNAVLDVNINGKISINGLSDTYSSYPDQPLFILDGFETTLQRISDLSMDRVESITILKDASSTAIYGAKAANGVVVVETKKPERGKLRFSYSGNYQLAWADLSDYNLMNAGEKLQFEKLSGYYGVLDDQGEILNDSQRSLYYSRLKSVIQGVDSYWMNEPLRTALTHDHSLNATGGDSDFRYGLTLRLKNTEGVMHNSGRKNIDGTLDLSYRISRFSFSNQTNIYYTGTENNVVPFSDFSTANPYYSKWDENGESYRVLQSWQEIDGTHYAFNPLWDYNQNSYNKGNQLSVNDNLNIEYRPIEKLRIIGRLGITINRDNSEVFKSPFMTQYIGVEQLKRGSYNSTSSNGMAYDGSMTVSYGDIIGKHAYNIVGGAQLTQQENKQQAYSAYGYITDMFSNPNFSNSYPEGGKPTSNVLKTRSASFYLNANYAFDMRYLFDLNVRTDGASVFGVNNPFSSTWSFGVAWNVHNEKWFKGSSTLNLLKLRYSLGNPGLQNINAKIANNVYTYYTSYPNMFGLSAIISQWGNKDLKWQRTTQHNWGANLEMFKRRLSLVIDYTWRKTDPILLAISQPASTGASLVPMNIGATDNKSFSVSARYTLVQQKALTWLITANAIHTKTKYKKIGDLLEKMNENGRASQTLLRYYDGASSTALWAMKSLGIEPMTGNEVFMKPDGSYTFKWDSADEVVCGDATPDLEGNFGSTLRYKGFSLTMNFRYRYGGQAELTTLLNKVENISYTSLKYNQDKRALYDRWQKPGDVARFKRIDDTSATNLSSRFIADDNTLEFQSVTLGYETTTAKWLSALGLTAFNFRIYTNNILRLSSIKEERGLDYPFQRSVSASLGLRF